MNNAAITAIAHGSGTTNSANRRVTFAPIESATRTVKEWVPSPAGVPETRSLRETPKPKPLSMMASTLETENSSKIVKLVETGRPTKRTLVQPGDLATIKLRTNALEQASTVDGRRIGVKLGSTWRYDLHDGMICLGSVSNGILDKFFVRGVGIADGTGDVIAEMRRDTGGSWTPHFYVANHRGDTVLVYNQNGANEYFARYDAFGTASQASGTFTPTYTFSTKEYLTDAKLYLYAYRVYDPVAGRWIQRDPIDYQDSPNIYQFCGNNPLNRTDIDGRFGIIVTIIAVVGIVTIGVTLPVSRTADPIVSTHCNLLGLKPGEGMTRAGVGFVNPSGNPHTDAGTIAHETQHMRDAYNFVDDEDTKERRSWDADSKATDESVLHTELSAKLDNRLLSKSEKKQIQYARQESSTAKVLSSQKNNYSKIQNNN